MSPADRARQLAHRFHRLSPQVLAVVILVNFVLGLGALGIGVVSLSRQTGVATDRANAAITAAIAARADGATASCEFILAFVVRPGEPSYTTPRGRLQEQKARAAYEKNGCTAITGPIDRPAR